MFLYQRVSHIRNTPHPLSCVYFRILQIASRAGVIITTRNVILCSETLNSCTFVKKSQNAPKAKFKSVFFLLIPLKSIVKLFTMLHRKYLIQGTLKRIFFKTNYLSVFRSFKVYRVVRYNCPPPHVVFRGILRFFIIYHDFDICMVRF